MCCLPGKYWRSECHNPISKYSISITSQFNQYSTRLQECSLQHSQGKNQMLNTYWAVSFFFAIILWSLFFVSTLYRYNDASKRQFIFYALVGTRTKCQSNEIAVTVQFSWKMESVQRSHPQLCWYFIKSKHTIRSNQHSKRYIWLFVVHIQVK